MIAARPSLTLVHQTRSRWRFRIENYNQSFDWNVFKHELSTLFSEPIWSIRTNQWSKSLVIHYTESSSPSRVNHSSLIQSRVNQVLASLGINMATTPYLQSKLLTLKISSILLLLRVLFSGLQIVFPL